MSYLIYTDLISCLLDPKLVDLGSTLVHAALKFNYKLPSKNISTPIGQGVHKRRLQS